MREMEIVTLGAADGLVGPRRAKPGEGPKHANVHTECLNCGATLHGRYCQDCGQTDDDHHRSIFHLIWEAIEGLTHLDGRLMRTVPPLFIHPGRLARDHFEGRRQRHVPPFRLFLVTLLLFMLSLEISTHLKPKDVVAIPGVKISTSTTTTTTPDKPPPAGAAAPAATPSPPFKPEGGATAAAVSAQGATAKVGDHLVINVARPQHEADTADALRGFDEMDKSKSPVMRWFAEHGRKAVASREQFLSIMFDWGHRLAILMLPIFAGFLTLFYFYKRQFYVYDHLVVAMHFLSFTFLLWAVVYLLPAPLDGPAMLIATVWTPVNLFMTLRGAYGSSVLGAGIKALSLWLASLFLFLALLMGVVVLALGSI